jgi:hypothetical protein
VIDNGTVVWGGRTALAGDAGAGHKTYSVASLMIGGSGAIAKLAVPDQIADLTVLNTGPLTIAAGGTLDLTKNEAMVSEPLSMLRSQIHDHLVTTSIAGLAVGSLDLGGVVEARATLLGDSDLDGQVNVADLANLAGNFGVTTGATWLGGDFDYNDNVNVADLADLAGNFGKDLVGAGFGGGAAAAGASSLAAEVASPAAAAVPEPASALVMSSLTTVLLTARRRRRRRRLTHV